MNSAPPESGERNAAVIRNLFDSLNARDVARWSEWLDPDCVQELPYAPEGFPSRFAPAQAVISHFDEALSKRSEVRFYDLVVTVAADPDVVFAEFRQDSPVPGSDRRYRQSYINKFRFKNGRIVRWDEYFNPLAMLAATGGLDAAKDFFAAR